MTVGAKRQGIVFYVSIPNEVTAVPTQQNILNSFDLAGDLLSTPRLEGESNATYKQRLLDVMVHPGGPIYEGIVNDITRGFGYERERAILIELKTNSSGDPIATNPRVDILANRAILYSDWRPDETETIDSEIYFYKTDSDGYLLSDLVSEINDSTCFSASIYSGVRSNLHATNLIRGTSDIVIHGDLIEAGPQTDLSATMLIEDSLIFAETNIFKTEVTGTPSASGEYSIDYINGRIYPYDTPSGTSEVAYHYANFPMVVDYSLVKVYSLQDDDFVQELFVQETLDSGEEINSLPNTEGSEIYHQLFKETNVFWGE